MNLLKNPFRKKRSKVPGGEVVKKTTGEVVTAITEPGNRDNTVLFYNQFGIPQEPSVTIQCDKIIDTGS